VRKIARYKRTARTFDELGLGALTPLCEAVPEIAEAGGPSALRQMGHRSSEV
jgi:hypothetical protein